MKNLNKEDIRETLERLRDYSKLMYLDVGSRQFLERQQHSLEGRDFTVSVRSNGLIEVLLEGEISLLYEVCVTTTNCLPDTIDNLNYNARLVNKDALLSRDLEFANKLTVCILSYFQRSIAFLFFARIADETIEVMINDLIRCNK